MFNLTDFVRTVIYNEETAVASLWAKNLLDDPQNDVINCNKCENVMQSKRRKLIRLTQPNHDHTFILVDHISKDC